MSVKKGIYADFEKIILNYRIAIVNCPAKVEEATGKILNVFKAINQLKLEAYNANRSTQKALKETQLARDSTQNALDQANKLINALYFYKDPLCFGLC